MKQTIIFIIVTVAVMVSMFAYSSYTTRGPQDDVEMDAFAQCLTDAGAVMYGQRTCTHCKDEKRAFGSSFQYIEYVECLDDEKRCIDEGIEGVPTWIFSDGERYIGRQGLINLSKHSGCSLSEDY